jgi:hypothetical protein
MWKWLSRLILWPIALVCALAASAFFLIQQEPVQQFVAKKVVALLNEDFKGDIDFTRATVQLHGAAQVSNFKLRDENGELILSVDRVAVLLAPWDLALGRVHVLKANLEGVRGNVDFTNNELNIAQAFAPENPSPPPDTAAAPLWIRLDRLRIQLDSVRVSIDSSFQKTFVDYAIAGDVMLTDSTITYDADISAPSRFSLISSGVVRPLSDSLFAGDVTFEGTSQYVQSEWAPDLPDLGPLHLKAKAHVQTNHLTSVFDMTAISVGSVTGDIEIDDYTTEPHVSLGAEFHDISLSSWVGDSIAHVFNGRAALVKSKSPEWTHDWSGRVELDSSFWDNIEIDADVETQLFEDAAGLAGEIRTNAGSFNVRVFSDGLSPDSMRVTGHARLANAVPHQFVPAIPDSLSPLSGDAEFSFEQYPNHPLKADVQIVLGAVSLGRYKLDSLSFHAQIDSTTFTLDSTRLRLGSASALLFAHGDYTKEISTKFSAELPAIEEFRALLSPYLPQIDSITGDAALQMTAQISLAADTLSDLLASGSLASERISYGNYVAHAIEVTLDTLALNDEYIRASLKCDSVIVGEENISPISLKAFGHWLAPQYALSVAARKDTFRIYSSGSIDLRQVPYEFQADQLQLDLIGTTWHNDFPVVVTFDSLHYEVEALIMRSDYGVLRATGFLENPGDQDLAVEFSGFRTGSLTPLLQTEIPDGILNMRLQLSGSDSAIVGDIDLVIDSVTYMKASLADQITLTTSINDQRQLACVGKYLWYGDTVIIMNASIPATFSLQDGIRVSDLDELSGSMRVDSLKLSRVSPWLSAGTSLDGFLSADLALTGSIARPDWKGDLSLRDGFYRDTRYGMAYKWIVLDATLQRDSIHIDNFRATSRGTMTGSGFAKLGVPWPEALDLNLNFDNFEAVSSRLQKARLDGNLTVSGPFDSLDASGKLTVQEGFYRLTQSATKSIEPINLDSVLAVMRGDTSSEGFNPDAFYMSMSHDLTIAIPGNFWIRGSGLNTELSGQLRLEKQHHFEPTANGEIAIKNGTVKFYGQELRIADNSTIRFDGPPDVPELNISAVYKGVERERAYEVSVKLTGTPDNSLAEFSGKFDDGTVMSSDEAIQKLLPFVGSSDGTAFDAEHTVIDAASGEVSNIVSKASGLDVFEFRPGPGGLNDLSSGQLELGTYVTDRLFVRVFQPIDDPRSGQKVSIDYRLLNWMKITAEQDSKSAGSTSSSFTVYLQFEWR